LDGEAGLAVAGVDQGRGGEEGRRCHCCYCYGSLGDSMVVVVVGLDRLCVLKKVESIVLFYVVVGGEKVINIGKRWISEEMVSTYCVFIVS
jgi:hypothetical protein